MTRIDEDAATRKWLDHWRGGSAQFWEFSCSHDKLTIRIVSARLPGNLHIVCSPCESISGPVRWDKCDIRLSSEDLGDDVLYTVSDRKAGVEVKCRGVGVFNNVEPVY